jgi:hypothetical protein
MITRELAKYVLFGAKNVSNKTYVGNSTQILYPANSSVSRPVFDIMKMKLVNALGIYCTLGKVTAYAIRSRTTSRGK